MKFFAFLFGALLPFAGCQLPPKPTATPVAQSLEPAAAPITVAELDLHRIENVRVGETLKAYPTGRYVDPNDPNVMHEAHTIYRREAAPSKG